MKKLTTIYLSISLLCCAHLSGQENDSLTFANYPWNTQSIKEGLVWKQANFTDLFSSRQEINILEVDLHKLHAKVKLAGHPDSLVYTSDFAKSIGASAAINGGFFNTRQGGAVDFIKIDGQIINSTARANERANAILAFDAESLVLTDVLDTLHVYETYPNVLRSGPQLLAKGNRVTLSTNAFNNNRHPRTAIALRDSTLILVTVDGRNANAHGMSLQELASILKWLGSTEAMNLDGGGSTTMYLKGATPSGIVNYPSDNKQFDHGGERKVANAILVE